MITEFILTKLLDASINKAKNILNESNSRLIASKEKLEQSISHHLRLVNNWSKGVSFKGINQAKLTTDVFIELDIFIVPRITRNEGEKEIETLPLEKIFEYTPSHFILLGQLGAGKTTSMKYLCQTLFLDNSFQDKLSFPLLIKLRELNGIYKPSDSSPIINFISGILGLEIELSDHLDKEGAREVRKRIKERVVIGVLENLKVLLILDGFDELNEDRDEVIQDIRLLASQLDNSRMIVTSRTGDFVYNIANAPPFEISSLKDEQISAFAIKWLKDQKKAEDFLYKIHNSPVVDTTIRPLTLAHLCAIYERTGDIPDKPKTMYKKTVNLLLEEWDQQRSVKRSSKYAHFEIDRKFEFLSSLAYGLTTTLKMTSFSESNLLQVYKQIYEDYGLKENEAKAVIKELETHTGLFLQTGYERYEFAHKSFQEYLTAEYMVKLPVIPTAYDELRYLPNELAIAVAISSNPSVFLIELILKRLSKTRFSGQFLITFINRLILEKPDLNSGLKTAWALVILFSLYCENHRVLLPAEETPLGRGPAQGFEALIKSVVGNRSLYLHHYEIHQYQYHNVLRMTKKSEPTSYPYLSEEELPPQLYVPKWLIQDS